MADHAADVTLVEALADLGRQGYSEDFQVEAGGAVRCGVCGRQLPPDQVDANGFRRLEGASDPGDMALVLGVACPGCRSRGAIVLRYGPEAVPEEAALLAELSVRHGWVVPPQEARPPVPGAGEASGADGHGVGDADG